MTEGTVLSYSNDFVCLENSHDFQNTNSQLQLNVMVFEVPSNGIVLFYSVCCGSAVEGEQVYCFLVCFMAMR